MCCDCVFGGDIEHPSTSGWNQYKLWTRSSIFEVFYCLTLLFAVFIAIYISLSKSSLNICYEPSLIWVLLAHIIKPFIIAIFMKCIPSKPMCCGILRLSPMFFMDLPYAIFVFIFSWFPLLQCIMHHELTIDSVLLFILLSCLVIHLIFPMMATLRLIEVIVFERRVKSLREHNQHRNREQIQMEVAPTVPINDERTELALSEQKENNSLDYSVDDDEVKDQFDETFMYGAMDDDHKTSLSTIFAASTKFISSGIFNKWDEEDICIICYDNFEKGKLCAKLKCGHFFHRDCVKEWLAESATCPLCRIGVTKK